MKAVLLAALMLALSALGRAADQPADVALSKGGQDLVDQATILLLPGTCAGVIVGDQQHAITAAHCISDAAERFGVELRDGQTTKAAIERLDRGHDVALLRFDERIEVAPLRIATDMPRLGDALYFGGRRDRHGSAQVFAVLKIGRCPSLPQVDNAVFTNLRARKGDSGAPLVNKALEVVALVHGGARCNIAAPIVGLQGELGL